MGKIFHLYVKLHINEAECVLH